jgi:16S rRNA (cytidine1402-2'-O)-methyltransferase
MLEPQQFQTQGFIDLRLCRERHNSGMPSGATAFVPALVNSGLPNDKFVFEGFYLTKKENKPVIWLCRETHDDFMFLLIN